MLISSSASALITREKFYTVPFPFLPPSQASSSSQLDAFMKSAGEAEVSPTWGLDANVSPMLGFLEDETSPNQAGDVVVMFSVFFVCRGTRACLGRSNFVWFLFC